MDARIGIVVGVAGIALGGTVALCALRKRRIAERARERVEDDLEILLSLAGEERIRTAISRHSGTGSPAVRESLNRLLGRLS